MKVYISLLFLITPSLSFATDLTVCMNKKGRVIAKARCGRGETTLLASNLGAFGLQGAPGTKGTFDPALCQKRRTTAAAPDTVNVDVFCLQREVAVSGACDSNSPHSYIRAANLIDAATGPYKDNAFGGYSCAMSTLDGSFHTVTAQVWCCQP